MTAWKRCELKVCRAWGGERCGNRGEGTSDCIDTPVALEVTRTKGGRIRRSKWEQAKTNARTEGKPPVLVVADHGQTVDQMVAVVSHGWLLDVCRRAGVIDEERKAA